MMRDRLQDLIRNRAVGPNSADADTQPGPNMGIIATALVAAVGAGNIRAWQARLAAKRQS